MIFLIVFFLFFTGYLESRKKAWMDAAADTWIIFTAVTVAAAEGLSLFHLYNRWGLSFCWGLADVVMAGCIIRQKKTENARGISQKREMFSAALLAGLLVLVMARALLYPSRNTDSYMYHLERAFMYYKNASIHNYPAAYCWVNYSGPLNAVFMAQSIVLTNGTDILCNLVQFPLLLVSVIAVYRTSIFLGASEKRSVYIAAFLTLCMPLAVLEAATTQCDLMLAGYCSIAVYYMCRLIDEKKMGTGGFFLPGLSIGAAVLTKASAGLILFPFIIFFFVFMVARERSRAAVYFGSIVLSGILAVSGWCVRNMLDLNGDFLALKLSSDSMGMGINEPVIQNIFGRILLNSIYTLGGPLKISAVLTGVGKKLYVMAGGTEDISSYTCYASQIWHDYLPYPVYTILAGISIAAVMICAGKITKKRTRATGYAICAMASWCLVSASLAPGIRSIARYLMPCIFLMLPVIVIFMAKLAERKRSAGIVRGICCMVYCIAVYVNVFDYRQPLYKGWFEASRYELRQLVYPDRNWMPAIEEYKKILKREDIRKIAISQEVISGFYPFLYELGESRYDVKVINGRYASMHEDALFLPDAIVLICKGGDEPPYICYHDNMYGPVSKRYDLYINDGETQLYVIQQE